MDEKIFTLQELADKYLLLNEKVPEDIIQELNLHIKSLNLIGIAQINTHSGNLEYNAVKIANYIKYAKKIGLRGVIFPEYSLTGCLLDDVFKRYPILLQENLKWLKALAKLTDEMLVVVGFVDLYEGALCDSLAIMKNGAIQKIIHKSSGSNINFNSEMYSFEDIGFVIGDDLEHISENNLEDIFINNNFVINCCSQGVSEIDKKNKCCSISSIASKYQKPLLFVNQVGVTDYVEYSGTSFACNLDGHVFGSAKSYEEQLLLVDVENHSGKTFSVCTFNANNEFYLDYDSDLERTYNVLVQGVKNYFNKCSLKRAVLGLSGGLDSTICAVLLADAIGKENVFGISMPSHITTSESKSDAESLAHNLGIHFIEKSIKPMIATTSSCLDDVFSDVEKCWGRYWSNESKEFTNEYVGNKPVSFTPDNIQARSRAIYLWGVANEFSSCIPIATSDKSELYMGYATINGDMSGGFAPIADVPKTKLFALARWMNKNREIKNAIPESIILKRPGAELAINPKTGKPLIAEDALMPYEFLDEIIWRIEHKHQTYNDLLDIKFLYELEHNVSCEQKKEWLDKFYRRMSFALYKWTLLPPSIKVDDFSILKGDYFQPVTSSKINYEGEDPDTIENKLFSL